MTVGATTKQETPPPAPETTIAVPAVKATHSAAPAPSRAWHPRFTSDRIGYPVRGGVVVAPRELFEPEAEWSGQR